MKPGVRGVNPGLGWNARYNYCNLISLSLSDGCFPFHFHFFKALKPGVRSVNHGLGWNANYSYFHLISLSLSADLFLFHFHFCKAMKPGVNPGSGWNASYNYFHSTILLHPLPNPLELIQNKFNHQLTNPFLKLKTNFNVSTLLNF